MTIGHDFPYKSAISNFITYSMSNGSCSELLSRVYSSDRWSRFIARHGWKPVALVSKRVSQIFTLLLYLNLDLRRRGRKYVGAASRVFSVDFFFFFFFCFLRWESNGEKHRLERHVQRNGPDESGLRPCSTILIIQDIQTCRATFQFANSLMYVFWIFLCLNI